MKTATRARGRGVAEAVSGLHEEHGHLLAQRGLVGAVEAAADSRGDRVGDERGDERMKLLGGRDVEKVRHPGFGESAGGAVGSHHDEVVDGPRTQRRRRGLERVVVDEA